MRDGQSLKVDDLTCGEVTKGKEGTRMSMVTIKKSGERTYTMVSTSDR